MAGDEKLLKQLSEGGQNPVSVVVGCADSRAPIEIIFDMRPRGPVRAAECRWARGICGICGIVWDRAGSRAAPFLGCRGIMWDRVGSRLAPSLGSCGIVWDQG